MIELEVRHIVVPRVEIDFLTLEHTLEENLERMRTSGHSRFALCELGLDTIVGVVHAKDVLDATLKGETPDLRFVAREPLFVSDTMSLSNFLRELQSVWAGCRGRGTPSGSAPTARRSSMPRADASNGCVS